MAHRAERWAFIEDYLKHSLSASVVDSKFHEAYHKKFPGYKVRMKIFGACPVPQAMRDLVEMSKSGILQRFKIGLGFNWEPGFPKWVWVYELRKT